MSKCPACLSETSIQFANYTRLAAFLFPVPHRTALEIEKIDLLLNACCHCSHIYQDKPDIDLINKIHKDYYRHYPVSSAPNFELVYREPFDKFFDNNFKASEGKRLLEIGCSKKENLFRFAGIGFDCIGIDPSPLLSNDNLTNITLISGFYENTDIGNPVDIIIMRFVLEHIVELDSHLDKMHRDLLPGGRVFVQVPNTEYYLSAMQPLFAAHEHPNYFTAASIEALFNRHGFKKIQILAESFEPSLCACFEKSFENTDKHLKPANVNLPYLTYTQHKNRIKDELLKYIKTSATRQIILYGCGLLCWWILSELESELVQYNIVLVDDNIALHQHFIAWQTGLEVQKPDQLKITTESIVILTVNPCYHNVIMANINKLGWTTPVLRLISNGQWLF